MIALDNITVRAGSATLVDGVSLRIRPGCVTALIGPNGAGKSTLVRVATGEHAPTAGRVTMEGTPLKAWSLKAQAGVRAVVGQQVTLSFPFDVLDVVLMGRLPHLKGRETMRDVEIACTALDQVSARHLIDRSYTTLSGGERQRVDLARALAQLGEAPQDRNRYLLLDEPTASLDIAHQHEMLRVVRRIAAQHIGVLIVLHDLNLAAQYADEIVLLCRGRQLACGRPEVVLVPDLIQQAFALPVLVTPHPCHDCPLIVPITGSALPSAQSLSEPVATLSP